MTLTESSIWPPAESVRYARPVRKFTINWKKDRGSNCYEMTGSKHYDFEEVAEPTDRNVQYRCEDCGMLIQLE
jgi:hypothetical protein